MRAERTVTGATIDAAIPAVSMHQVGLSFGNSSPERRLVLADITLDVREGEVLMHRRSVGIGQDHAAANSRRAHSADGG